MILTAGAIAGMGFAAGDISEGDVLLFYAAVEWLNENTDYGEISLEDPEAGVTALPPSAKVFISRYIKMIRDGGLSGSNVSSESIAGMSRSYVSAADAGTLFSLLAEQLLGDHYIGGRVQMAPDVSGGVYVR